MKRNVIYFFIIITFRHMRTAVIIYTLKNDINNLFKRYNGWVEFENISYLNMEAINT